MRTNRDTVKALLKFVLTRLENLKAITLLPEKRLSALAYFERAMELEILTEQDIHDRTVVRMGANAEALNESEFTETDKYRTARALIRKELGENELNGLYFQKNLKTVSQEITGLLMDCPDVEEVFESDAVIEKAIVEVLQKFDPKNQH